MTKTLWTCLVLLSLIFVYTEASKKGGKSKTGGWGSNSGSRNPSYPGNTGNTGNTGSNWNQGNRGGQNPGYPQGNPAYPQGNPSYPQGNPAYPPGYPQGNPAYPGNTGNNWNRGGQNPAYPQGNPQGGWNPNYPNNPGTNWNQGGGHNYNPGGSNYNNKQWKPDKKKTNMKMVAGAAAVGVVGGYVLGSAMSNMRYSFDNDRDSRYYNSYRNEMPNQVYKPQYQANAYVPEDRFVTDCYNNTVTEYIVKPNEGKNASEINEQEIRVKTTIIRQMCVTEYQRSPEYLSYNSGLKIFFSSSFTFFLFLFVYFVVQ